MGVSFQLPKHTGRNSHLPFVLGHTLQLPWNHPGYREDLVWVGKLACDLFGHCFPQPWRGFEGWWKGAKLGKILWLPSTTKRAYSTDDGIHTGQPEDVHSCEQLVLPQVCHSVMLQHMTSPGRHYE